MDRVTVVARYFNFDGDKLECVLVLLSKQRHLICLVSRLLTSDNVRLCLALWYVLRVGPPSVLSLSVSVCVYYISCLRYTILVGNRYFVLQIIATGRLGRNA